MEFSIGIVTAEQSQSLIRQVEPFMTGDFSLTYLPYATMRQLGELYARNNHRFDGLIFSGRFPYEYIVNHVGAVMKPHAYFELTDRDYYKMFAALMFRFPGISIARIAMEKPFGGLEFGDVFGDVTPMYFEDITRSASTLESAYESTLEQSIRLWRSGKIDRVITRLTNLIEPLKAAGIPCETSFPSVPSMQETFGSLYSRLQSRALDDSMTAAGLVSAGSPDEDMELLGETLAGFNRQHGMGLVIRRHEDVFELTTSNEILKDITLEYTHCLLSAYLRSSALFSPAVGWGLGRDIMEAQHNAAKALRESRQNGDHNAYLINSRSELVGPLANGRGIAVNNEPDTATGEISKDLGISSANLQKIIDLQRKRGTNRFTSAELAYYLNITPRSANRILIKLAEHGGAKVVQTVQSSARGRPFNIYEVDYKRLDPRFLSL